MTNPAHPSAPLHARWLQMAARATLSGAALLWVLHTTPLRTISAALNTADLPLLVGGLALNVVVRFAAAERTLAISRALGLWISRWQTIETLFISNFYALLSPGPFLSGVVTIYRYKGYGASISGSVGALLASRMIECVMFIALGTVCVLIDRRIALTTVQYPVLLATCALLAVVVVLAGLWLMQRHWKHRNLASAPVPDPGRGFLAGVREVRDEVMRRGPSMVFQAAIPAAAQVMLAGAASELLARSLGIEVSLLTSIWMTAAVYAVVLLPVSIAGVGVREVTLIKSLALLGVGSGPAVALSILLFADPVINALIGVVLQLRSALSTLQRQA